MKLEPYAHPVSIDFEDPMTGEKFEIRADVYLEYNLDEHDKSKLIVKANASELIEQIERARLALDMTHRAIALNMEERDSTYDEL